VDPSVVGPFITVTDNEVGPQAGAAPDGGVAPKFTMFRPKDMVQGGLCHPVITWGNGTNVTPAIYHVLLDHLASHGFVVIGSNSTNVAQGNPAPMVVGVTWVLQQNDDPTSVLYQRIDTTHIGAAGHSQGAMATVSAGGDSHITTISPICGAGSQRNLHGPAMLVCGDADTLIPCSSEQSSFDGITNQPVIMADYITMDHGNWISFSGTTLTVPEVTVVAWMRVQLMGDTALRSWFYGASCKLCQDPAWKIQKKMMDQ
jgi:predicted dienelactone hydrolase